MLVPRMEVRELEVASALTTGPIGPNREPVAPFRRRL
jgi:hypothetical protein